MKHSKTTPETRQNADIVFHGQFINHGNIIAKIHAKPNTYNIFEDPKHQNETIIEFNNHQITPTHTPKTQFDNKTQALQHLQSLKITTTNNKNTYKQFLQETAPKLLENLKYPIIIEIVDSNEVLGHPKQNQYVTIIIIENTFNKNMDLTIKRGEYMSRAFLRKLSNICSDYDYYKNSYIYDIYVFKEAPHTKQQKLIHKENNINIPFTDEINLHSQEIAIYIENNVLNVNNKTQNSHDYNSKIQLCENHRLSKNFFEKNT